MKCKSPFYAALCMGMLGCISMFAHRTNAHYKEDKYLIAKPVLGMYEETSVESPFVSQGVYGHSVYVIERLSDTWAIVETEEGYRGYAILEDLLPDDPRWRTSRQQCCVAAVCAKIYPQTSVHWPPICELPFGARIEVLIDPEAQFGRWIPVRLLDGSVGWIHKGDVERPTLRTLEEVVALSKRFLDLPYVWGGTSSFGFDCSGYVQMLFRQMGVILPRDSRPQAASDVMHAVEGKAQEGDLVFFRKDEDRPISHVGLVLNKDQFIVFEESADETKCVINALQDREEYQQAGLRRFKPVVFTPNMAPIPEHILNIMLPFYKENNPVSLEDLCYIQLQHWGFDYCVHEGELVVHKAVAEDIVAIFQELFNARYPIEKMHLIEVYNADDTLACEDNNTSAFCSRPVVGRPNEWSYHSYGLAIDINPLLNPYHKEEVVIPEQGRPFLDRTLDCRGLIVPGDACYNAFISRGWKWGGNWKRTKDGRQPVDYQHFYKEKLAK